jgi:hypothetical protein
MEFADATRRPRRTILRALSSLQSGRVLLKRGASGTIAAWRFNKDYDLWTSGAKNGTASPKQTSVKSGSGTSVKSGTALPKTDARSDTPHNEIKKEKRKRERKGPADRVFAIWKQQVNVDTTTAKLTKPARVAVNAKLREGYDEKDLIAVINNYDRLVARAAAPGFGEWSFLKLMRDTEWFDNLRNPKWMGLRKIKDAKPEWKPGSRKEERQRLTGH